MTNWLLKCNECGTEWVLKVSFNLEEMGKIYHYCKKCGKNTFHTVIKKTED